MRLRIRSFISHNPFGFSLGFFNLRLRRAGFELGCVTRLVIENPLASGVGEAVLGMLLRDKQPCQPLKVVVQV